MTVIENTPVKRLLCVGANHNTIWRIFKRFLPIQKQPALLISECRLLLENALWASQQHYEISNQWVNFIRMG